MSLGIFLLLKMKFDVKYALLRWHLILIFRTKMENIMREVITSKNAPAAVGFYSQAVKVGNFLFLSGQICINPYTNKLERENVKTQTIRIMENIKAIVEEAGGTMDNVVKCQVFLSDMKHFPDFDATYGTYFEKPYPARLTVACAGIYENLDVEIDVIVCLL